MPNHMTFRPPFPRTILLRTTAVLATLLAWPAIAAAHFCTTDDSLELIDATSPASPALADDSSMVATGLPGRGSEAWRRYLWDVKTLRIVFLDSPPEETTLRRDVEKYAREWLKHANLEFEFHASMEAFRAIYSEGLPEIRIQMAAGKNRSVIGIQARHNKSPDWPTMRLGSVREMLRNGNDAIARRIVLHEFGHALGRDHEHQNPAAGIQWNVERLLRDCTATNKETNKETTEDDCRRNIQRNMLTDEEARALDGRYDPSSIMHYPIPEEQTLDSYFVGVNFNLSRRDIARAGEMYPFENGVPSAPPPKAAVADGHEWLPGPAIPDRAIFVGIADDPNAYVCRVELPDGSFEIGMTSDGRCVAVFDGQAAEWTTYDILTAAPHRWEGAFDGNIPKHTLTVALANGQWTYPCRIRVGDRNIAGRISDGRCVAANGKRPERVEISFEILVPESTESPPALWRHPYVGDIEQKGDASLAACRARFADGVHLGRVVNRVCLVGAHIRGNPLFQILAGMGRMIWVPAASTHLPPHIPPFGRVMNQGTEQPVGLCRVIEDGQTYFGQLASDGVCRFGREGRNTPRSVFDVLVASLEAFPMEPVSSADPGGWVSPSLVSQSDDPRLCRVPHGNLLLPGWVDGEVCRYLDMAKAKRRFHRTFQVLDLSAAHDWVAAEGAVPASAVRVGHGNDDDRVVCRGKVIKNWREGEEIVRENATLAIGAVYEQKCHIVTQESWWSLTKFEVAVRRAE